MEETRMAMVSGTPFLISVGLWQHLDSLNWSQRDSNGHMHITHVDPSVFRWIVIYEREYQLPREATALPDLYTVATQLKLRALLAYLDSARQNATSSGFRRSFQGIRKSLQRNSSNRDLRHSMPSLQQHQQPQEQLSSPHLPTDGIHKGDEKEYKRANSFSRLKVSLPRTDSFRKMSFQRADSWSGGSQSERSHRRSPMGSSSHSTASSPRTERRSLMGSERLASLMPKASSFRRPRNAATTVSPQQQQQQQHNMAVAVSTEFGFAKSGVQV